MFLTRSELAAMDFATCGNPVLIDDRASIYGSTRIRMGSHVRIDATALLSAADGSIELGSYVHISAAAQVYGGGTVVIGDCVSVSPRASLLSVTDDFQGAFLTGPLVPDSLRNVLEAPIECEMYSVIGSGAVVLPGVRIGRGASIGALSLVKEDVPAGAIMAGVPARQIGVRDLGELESRARQLRDLSAEQ
jgi:dTDP-4-amino-4,6-dideoxy-D-glucose acyltransferase